ncbi:glycine cleavage system aminomethyltransferase GcvT [Pelistega sp. MC2]|uniref:glycine cleavage system aminomethyltransferase GcvT n=1 Tax=Pelistega sp. MC2 TaxID=1720297 RepID=UPI0008DA1B78|nr:glycine cleavage system aminomethyltransferase GcvT [Pelistega sp. MC2]
MSSASLKHTALYQAHLNLNAKMVDFGGWEMPISYGSQIEEHHAVRKNAGIFDVSHMLNVDIIGDGAYEFLRHLIANDVSKITGTPGKALYSCMLNEQAGIIDDLIVYFFSENKWRVVVNAGTAEKDLVWMKMQSADYNVVITPRFDLSMVAVQGPKAREILWQVRPEWKASAENLSPFVAALINDDTMVARTGYTGEDGVEIVLPSHDVVKLWEDLIAAGVQACGLGARDTLRLEAGMNLYGQDMNEDTQPYQAGLAWTVSLKDESRQFVGRKILEELPVRNAFLGIKLLDRGVMRAHMKVRGESGEGEITSGTMSPSLGFSVGFVRMPEGAKAGDSVEVEIRGKWIPAVLTTLPFVRNGKALIA